MDIGELIIDPDVLFALQNLKALGKSLQDNESELQERPQPSKFGRNLFGDFRADSGQSATNILNPIGGGHGEIKQESQASKAFNSPPQTGRVFGGMKRLTPDTFAISSTKKGKVVLQVEVVWEVAQVVGQLQMPKYYRRKVNQKGNWQLVRKCSS